MENLRSIREAKRITQLQLSVEIGIAQETISAYENGKAMPSVDTLCKLADCLHTSTDYLLGRTTITTPIDDFVRDGMTSYEIEIISRLKTLSKEKKSKALGYITGLQE